MDCQFDTPMNQTMIQSLTCCARSWNDATVAEADSIQCDIDHDHLKKKQGRQLCAWHARASL
eukprot:565802-Amphidinium_carterae.3